jgi:hypothetical protein
MIFADFALQNSIDRREPKNRLPVAEKPTPGSEAEPGTLPRELMRRPSGLRFAPPGVIIFPNYRI